MTGSWYRGPRVLELLAESSRGELGVEHEIDYLAAEREAIRDQLHPEDREQGLSSVSNGSQRIAGYTSYLPNRFEGFSRSERTVMRLPEETMQEIIASNPSLAERLSGARAVFSLPRIEFPLRYRGTDRARREAKDLVRLGREEGAESVFLPSPSPGVVTLFYPNNPDAYPTHFDYLHALARELRQEYAAILEEPEVLLQIDAPDLAMGKHTATDWDVSFQEALPQHVDAINEAIRGLPRERIRVHYCYGNYAASHRLDADFETLLPELMRLRVGALVGELANPHHEGDLLVLEQYKREHGWPSRLAFVGGVIDVKTPIVESPRTVRMRLERLAKIVGPDRTWGGTDCGFETLAGVSGVTRTVALQKLGALVDGANSDV